MAKRKLGRGLGAILQDVEIAYKRDSYSNEEDSSLDLREIDLKKIYPNPYQPRRHFDEKSIEELSNSIKKHGLLQPIVVIQKDDGYMLIAGERRFRAVKKANLTTIKAIVADLESKNLRELALIENIQREDLNPMELAQSYKELILEYGITQEELSNIIHKSRTQITNTMRLLTLSQYTREKLINQKISQGHAKILVGLSLEDEKKIVDTIIGQKLSVRETEKIVQKIKNPPLKTSKIEKTNIKTLDFAFNKIKNYGFDTKKQGNSIIINFHNENEVEKFIEYFKK